MIPIDRVYKETANTINKELGRKAVTPDLLKDIVKEAKSVRRRKGTQGLIDYGSSLPERLFSPEEIDQLQRSPKYRSTASRLIDLLVYERVINPFEAMLFKRYL